MSADKQNLLVMIVAALIIGPVAVLASKSAAPDKMAPVDPNGVKPTLAQEQEPKPTFSQKQEPKPTFAEKSGAEPTFAEKPETKSVFAERSDANATFADKAGTEAAFADKSQAKGGLFSPSVSQRFYELAREMSKPPAGSPRDIDEAMVFLTAARELNKDDKDIDTLMIRLASKTTGIDRSKLIYSLLSDYVGPSADLEVVRMGITYLLERLNTREDRENLLARIRTDFAGSNRILDSELSTLMATLKVEKGDLDTAKTLLAQAYKTNRYNRLAFQKLLEIDPTQISPPAYFEHLRLVLREDPTDMDAAVNFAEYAEQLQLYEVAMEGYGYAARLFTYLYPTEKLPASIYLPWAISAYNTEKNPQICLQIASAIRNGGRFDLLLEAMAGKAAIKTGNADEAAKIFANAEQKAEDLLKAGPSASDGSSVTPEKVAWFYCFANPDSTKALDWANKAYSRDPNSPSGAAILAYALVLKDQYEWAKPLVKDPQSSQIAALVTAMIEQKQGNAAAATKMLNTAISKDPGSLAAEKARKLLADQGLEYVPPMDPQVVRTIMSEAFGDKLAPRFVKPEDMLDVQFHVRGNKFSYGGTFGANVAIVNKSSEPMIVSDYGLFKGGIRIDAKVSGDLNKDIPRLVSRKVRPTNEISPGNSVLIPVQLVTGELRRLLNDHPQASLNIEFTLYIDPVIDNKSKVYNRLVNLPPTKLLVSRPGIDLTGAYLRNRFNSISTGQQGQKIKTSQLFTGLLKEQQIMSRTKPLYRFRYADWMPDLLKSGLLHESGLLRSSGNDEWVIKVNVMADMLDLDLDKELTEAVADNINHSKWPVRLMAMYLLSRKPDAQFEKVVGWMLRNDQDQHVQQMAQLLTAPQQGGSAKPANGE